MPPTKCDCGVERQLHMRPFYYCFTCKAYFDCYGRTWERRPPGQPRRIPLTEKELLKIAKHKALVKKKIQKRRRVRNGTD